jgi:hypothetical protein
VLQVAAVLLLQVPVVVPAGIVQVPVLATLQQRTAVGFPQVERAAQLAIPAVEQPSLLRVLRWWTTQLWCWPWFFHGAAGFVVPPQGHAAATVAPIHSASVVQVTAVLLLHVPVHVIGHCCCARAGARARVAEKSMAPVAMIAVFITFPFASNLFATWWMACRRARTSARRSSAGVAS